jgi:hypothetical protein
LEKAVKIQNIWKSGVLLWEDQDVTYLSVVFSWDLPDARKYADMMRHRRVRIGGPAVELAKLTLPGFFLGCHAELGGDLPGILQRWNHLATRTSVGCPRKCKFCSVPQVAAVKSMEMSGAPITPLADWPDLPVLADDNLLFTPIAHFDPRLRPSGKVGLVRLQSGHRLPQAERIPRAADREDQAAKGSHGVGQSRIL